MSSFTIQNIQYAKLRLLRALAKKSRLLENFGAKLYDRRKRCPSNEPRSLWSVFVTPHPLTFYIRQNLVETLNYTSQGSHFITKHYDGHYSLNDNKSIFLQLLRWWLTPQQLMEAPFFVSLRWSHFSCSSIYFVGCV